MNKIEKYLLLKKELLNLSNNSISNIKQEMIKPALSIFTSIAILGSAAIGTTIGTKKISQNKKYNTSISEMIEGHGSRNKNIYMEYNHDGIKEDNINTSVVLRIYFPYVNRDSRYERNVTEYDLSKVNINNLEDYFNFDVSSLPNLKYVETKASLNMNDFYSKSYVQLYKSVQYLDDYIYETNESKLIIAKLFAYIIDLLLIVYIFGMHGIISDESIIEKYSNDIRKFLKSCKDIKNEKEKIDILEKEIFDLENSLNTYVEVEESKKELIKK